MKQGNSTQQKNKAKKDSAGTTKPDQGLAIPGFAAPSVGLALSSHASSSGSSSQPATANALPQQPKSIKATLHQRANRIGKVEARLSKLAKAIQDTKDQWPIYVNQMQQKLQQEHQRCVQFTQAAQAEMHTLQSELAELTSAVGSTPVQPVEASSDTSLVMQAAQVMLDYIVQSQTRAVPWETNAAMDVDVNHTTAIPDLLSYQVPDVASVMQHAQFPVPAPAQVPNAPTRAQVSVPLPAMPSQTGANHQGDWNWPPSMPMAQTYANALNQVHTQLPANASQPTQPLPATAEQVPTQQQRDTTASALPQAGFKTGIPAPPQTPEELFPNPLYKAKDSQRQPESARVILPLLNPEDPVIQDAMQGLRDLHSVPVGADLPPHVMQQLHKFAQQQEYCRQQIATMFPSQSKGTSQTAQVFPQELPPAPGTPQSQMPPCPSTPAALDTMSIHSSPAKIDTRCTKVAKATEGHVHQQPGMTDPAATPIPLSPSDTPRSMVPTEVAESEWGGPQANQLSSLE